jgi:hypothetical protein
MHGVCAWVNPWDWLLWIIMGNPRVYDMPLRNKFHNRKYYFRMSFKKLFKKKATEPAYNIHHPDIATNIELAFECGGKKYYRCVKEFILPAGRYKFIDAFLYEVELRMNLKTLKAYIADLKKQLDGSKGQVDLSAAFRIIYAMETRTELGFEPQTVKRLASVVYFDATEDLRDYNAEYCNKKIKFWEDNNCYDFFLTRPISELCGLNGISQTSLQTYIAEATQILKDLTYVPGTSS